MSLTRSTLAAGAGHQGANRVIRGGSWNSNARNVRAAYRNRQHPANRNDNLGLRLAGEQACAGWRANDPTGILSGVRQGVGEQNMGAGVGVGGAERFAKPHRWPA